MLLILNHLMHRISTVGYTCISTPFSDREIVGVVYCIYARNADGLWQPWRWCVKPVPCDGDDWQLLEMEPRIQYSIRGMH
jgi:hypothetical protein